MIEKIFILHHTHVDIGYTDDREKVCDELVAMVGRVIELVEGSAWRPEPERFRWIHEVSWPVLEYLRRGGTRQEDLFEQIREGRVELTALCVNPTDLFDREEFEVSVDWACQVAREQNLPLTTAMFSDCPGIPWSIPDILGERGVRYLSAAPDFIMSMPLEVERPFYWEGPQGNRLLTWFTDWRRGWYGEGLFNLRLHEDPAEATKRLLEYVAGLEGEGYRWKGLAIHVAMDNVAPKPELMDFVAHFNAVQEVRRAAMATNRDFFEFMERHHAGEFAVHGGAWPDWWANGNASAAYETACSRRAKASLRRSGALSRQLNRERDPALLRQVMENMCLFDEHTWGFRASVSDPWGLQSRKQWAEKRLLAVDALGKAHRLEDQIIRQLASGGQVVVANPFEEGFTGPIYLAGGERGRKAPSLKDTSTGEEIVGQRLRPKSTAGEPGDCYVLSCPPRTIRHFEKVRRKRPANPMYPDLENEHFRLEYDEGTGAVQSVYDKVAGCQLCDGGAAWSFAEVIHERVRRGSREAIYDVGYGVNNPEAKRPRPDFLRRGGHTSKRRSKLIAGEVFNSLLTFGRLPGVGFAREIRLFHATHRIDVLLRLDKQVVTDYESLYLAFPFAASQPHAWVENAGAVYRAGVDQLPGSATDWLSVGEYIAVCDSEHTAVLAPHDVPLVQVGDIHTGKWARRLEVRCGHVYSWVMNNMWFTNFPAHQEGVVKLAWSLTSHAGAFDAEAAGAFAQAARLGVLSTAGIR